MAFDRTGGGADTDAANQEPFHPFYECWADAIDRRLGISVFGRAIAALVPGLAFLVLHYLATGGLDASAAVARFHAWSWMIGIMIVCCCLLLYYATHVFKGLLWHIRGWQTADREAARLGRLTAVLSNENFIVAGVSFGGLNMLMGFWFGVPYAEIAHTASIFFGFFLIGFVCGMAVLGIYGVLAAIRVVARGGCLVLDFTAPGRCGGTQFLGDAFIKFSAVTLIMGVLISIYILFAGWTNQGSPLVRVAMGLWIVWPYLLAAAVLFGPASDVNRVLRDYKLAQEKALHERLGQLAARLEESAVPADERQAVEADIARFTDRRALLYAMRTWPFRSFDTLKFGAVLAANLVATSQGVLEFLDIVRSAGTI